MNKKNLLFLFLSLAMWWTGCTEEDFSHCPTGFWVTFVPENAKHNIAREVQNLDLYFYNRQDNDLIKKLSYTRSELRSSDGAAYVPQDSIPAGAYRVMAIANDGSNTDTRGSEDYYGIYTSLTETDIDYQPVTFFSGETELDVERFLAVDAAQEFPVYLYKHNNLIRLNIYYDKDYDLPPGGRVETYIHGSNGRYHHSVRSRPAENNPDLDALYAVYHPFERFDNAEGYGSVIYMSTMHMWHGSDIKIHFDPTDLTRADGEPWDEFDLNLTDLLYEVGAIVDENGDTVRNPYNSDDKLRFNDEYEISVKFGKTTVSTKIGLDDWATVGDNEVEI